MNARRSARWGAVVLAGAPAVLLFGFAYHPWIGSPTDPGFYDRLASAVTADPNRWMVAHLAVGVGSGLLAIAFVALWNWLREAGENRLSGSALPFIIMGSTLFAMLPAMEFAPLAVAGWGGDIQATQSSMMRWFVPILFSGAALFLLGSVGFAVDVARSALLSRPWRGVAVAAMLVMAISRFVPLGVIQLYLQGLAGIVAFWPLAYRLWVRAPLRQQSRAPARAPAAF